MPDQAVVTHRPERDAYVVDLAGDVDVDAVPDIELAISDAGRAGASRVVIGLSRVGFADSAIVHLLSSASHRYDLRLVGPLHPSVQRLLDMTGTAGRFPVERDLEAALRR
ncbi:STAS domain-containing protein [Streptomyces sp. NPDC051569]|uniref:STAS domain-containing protein n=1 Tax=Streptomyces sp. NPDC051569 TaxID=3365661 RepID=UPI0037AD0C57